MKKQIAVVAAVVIGGCTATEPGALEQTQRSSSVIAEVTEAPILAWEGIRVTPPPSPVHAASEPEPLTPPSMPPALEARLQRSRNPVRVFEGRVAAVSTSEEVLSRDVWMDGDKVIVTSLSIADVEWICPSGTGSAPEDTVTVKHVGGVLSDGRSLATSLSPHFSVGGRFLFATTTIDGNDYLVGGKNDVLPRDSDPGAYVAPPPHARVTNDVIKGACR